MDRLTKREGKPHVSLVWRAAMRHLGRIAAMCAVVVGTAAYAADYYVDANYGNDEWDGTTAAIPSQEVIDQCTAQNEPIPGPRKTLHAMMSDARVVAGDMVKAAEGNYNKGGEAYNTAALTQTVNRVQVKAGVTLLATGARDRTFITGSGGSGTAAAYTNGAARCVYFLSPPTGAEYGYGIVKGFTIRDGRTAPNSKKSDATAYAGGSMGEGLLVECDFVNNGCCEASRAGTIYQGTALRCRFTSYHNSYVAYSGTKIIDSLIVVAGTFYSSCKLYNCTFSGNGVLRDSQSYNCFYIGTGAASSGQGIKQNDGTYKSKSTHRNTFSRSEFVTTYCETNGTCRVVTADESPYDATTYRPLVGSALIDAGDMSYYVAATNGWPTAWLAECGKDYYGRDRVANGTIDVGCGEAQSGTALTINDSSDGLVVTGAEKGESRIAEGTSAELTFSRNFTSDRLCTGVEVDGVFHSFGGTTSDVPYAVTIPGVLGGVHNVVAVYETDQKDWYVSPTGDDSNKGYHRNCPRKTLVEAMKLATANAGHVVHAAAGTYDDGEVLANGCSNRVLVAKGVGLVADEWPLQETVIKGAADTTADADSNGNGPAAVRCVSVNSGGYVRGFKLTGGRTNKRADSNDKSAGTLGGGAYSPGGALVDCEIASVGCSYRGPAMFGDSSSAIIRCNVHDMVSGSYNVYGGRVIDTHIVGTCYNCPVVLNSTLTGQMRANEKTVVVNSYMQYAARAAFCTNCVFTRVADTAMSDGATYDPETCRFGVALASNFDENYRPSSPTSPLVDFGNKALYDKYFPAAWVQFKSGTDRTGGQRIYNAQIDVGCGEYDFRPDFAGYLGPKAVVSEMGPNVTTNAVPNIVVPEGESITVSMAPRSSGRPTAYELVYTPEGGSPTVVSESSTEPFSRTLDGACTVQSLVGHVGLVFSIR